jgi:hypothetical protein
MTISRMQQPRQMYGLGSLVKKAVKGVKSFVKSDLGKAALLGMQELLDYLAGDKVFFGFLSGLGSLKTGVGQFIGGISGGRLNPGAIAGDSMTSPFLYKAGKFLGSPMGILPVLQLLPH